MPKGLKGFQKSHGYIGGGAAKGSKSPMEGKSHTENAIKKIKEARKKQIIPKEARERQAEKIRGEKHWNWQGGKTKETFKIRNSKEYRLWREAVFERDNWTCIWCNQLGGKLEADHIKPFCYYPELRFAIDNGRTLCKECHSKIGWNLFRERNIKK